MAKNYSLKEMVKVYDEGTDLEAMMDIARRYPLLAIKTTRLLAMAGSDLVDFVNYIPEHITANKVNSAMKAVVEPSADVDDEADAAEVTDVADDSEPAVEASKKSAKAEKPAKAAKAEVASDSDYAKMSGAALWDLLGKHNLRKDCKEKMGGIKKEHMVAYLEKYGLSDSEPKTSEKPAKEAKKVEKPAKNAEAPAKEADATPYDGKSALELFKECKSRGIKVEPKKSSNYYIQLLLKDDSEKGPESFEDDEVWDDDEPTKPVKPAKAGKSVKKAEAPAKEADAEDEDDNWDI